MTRSELAAEKIRRIIRRGISRKVEYSLAVRPVVDLRDNPAWQELNQAHIVRRFCLDLQSGQDYLARKNGAIAE